jgi:hypothetical protein
MQPNQTLSFSFTSQFFRGFPSRSRGPLLQEWEEKLGLSAKCNEKEDSLSQFEIRKTLKVVCATKMNSPLLLHFAIFPRFILEDPFSKKGTAACWLSGFRMQVSRPISIINESHVFSACSKSTLECCLKSDLLS